MLTKAEKEFENSNLEQFELTSLDEYHSSSLRSN